MQKNISFILCKKKTANQSTSKIVITGPAVLFLHLLILFINWPLREIIDYFLIEFDVGNEITVDILICLDFFVDGKAEKPQVLQIIKIRKLLFKNFFYRFVYVQIIISE